MKGPIDKPPVDELDAALVDCVEEYRKSKFLGVVPRDSMTQKRTRSGYEREYICATDIHAMLEKRGIKRSKTTVSRRIKEFIEKERASFPIATWVDEMQDAIKSIDELTERMQPEWHKEDREAVDKALTLIRKVIQPWAVDQARSADDEETLARLVRYSTEYFGPGERPTVASTKTRSDN